MAIARLLQISLPVFAFLLNTPSSRALQLGESEAQIAARHGAPSVEDHSRHLAVYYWAGWSAQLEFQDSVVGKLTYHCNHYLEQAEIDSLLQANGGLARWHETTNPSADTRHWLRDDDAQAATDAARPAGMVFHLKGGDSALTAEKILTESFQKIEAAQAPPASPDEPARLDAPQLRPGSRPGLRAEDAGNEQPHSPILPDVKMPPVPNMIQQTPQPAVATVPAVLTGAWPAGAVVALFVVSACAGLALWLAKRRRARPAEKSADSPAPEAEPRTPQPPAAQIGPGLDALREDQIELLLGEIFRRQGYTIELSAALSADGGSDLILRRDGESIPVSIKDWKAARVTEREVREFYTHMTGTAAPRGVIATTGAFSRDARDFARDKFIELIDRDALDHYVAAVRRPEENFFHVPAWIEDFTAYARIFDPECPCCSQPMIIRRSRTDGSESWVCASYPRCAGKRTARRDLLALAAAA